MIILYYLIGKITIFVSLKSNGAYSKWYDNNSWSETPSVYNFSSTIDYNWGGGLITPTRADYVTSIFTLKLTSPTTDSYTLYTYSDDDCSLYVDGVLKFNGWTSAVRTQQTTVNFMQDHTYNIQVNYREQGGGAEIHLYWSWSTFAKTIIPSSNMNDQNYVGSTPITVASAWPTGYSGLIIASQTQWKEICGDGKRIGGEKWDDGNNVSSDGCNWEIESNWIWSGGNSTHQDFWSEWLSGYEPNSSKDSWVVRDIPVDIKSVTYSSGSLIVAGSFLNIITSICSNSSPQSSMTMLNSVQLILLLPLIGSYLSPNVLDFIRGMKFCLLSLDFLSMANVDINNVNSYIDFEQSNSYLYLIGLKSGSSGVNIFWIAGISILLPIIHGVISIFYLFIKNKFSDK